MLTQANRYVIEEGMQALTCLVRDIEQIWKLRPPIEPPPKGSVVSNGVIPALIGSVCQDLGTASLCLFSRGPLPTRFDNDARLARTAFLESKLQGISPGPLSDRAVRNRLTHIDEWLPRAFRADPDAATLQDLAITRRSMFKRTEGSGEIVFVRVYVMEEDCISHLGADMHLGQLHQSANDVLQALKEDLPDKLGRHSITLGGPTEWVP